MDQDFRNFDQIYRAYAVQIYRYLLSIGCPAQDAEDIVQETFGKALLRIDSYRGDAQISVWHRQTQTRGMSCVSQVVEIPDQYHVVIETVYGNVTLETTPVVTELLRTDGTDYVFSYQYMKHTPLKGTLNYISQIDEIDDRRQS